MSKPSQPRATFLFLDGHVGVAPTVINLSETFRQMGWSVSIHGNKTGEPVGDSRGVSDAVTVYAGRPYYTYVLPRLAGKLLRGFGMSSKKIFVEVGLFVARHFRRFGLRPAGKGEPSLLIGIDLSGIVAAYLISRCTREKYLMLSLENEPIPEVGTSTIIVRKLAKRALAGTECVIIQDRDRFESLSAIYSYRHPRVFFLPNSPSCVAGKASNSKNLLRDRLAIGKKEYPVLALSAGMINDAVFSRELAAGFRNIASPCALVFHDAVKRPPNDPYIQVLRELNNRNLFLSLEPVPVDEVDNVFRSATVGLAFYRDIGKNWSEIAMASGKLGYFLKHGVPVLVSDLPSFTRLFERFSIGIVVKDPTDSKEIDTALQALLADYAAYQANCRRCFSELFDFEKNVGPFRDFVSKCFAARVAA